MMPARTNASTVFWCVYEAPTNGGVLDKEKGIPVIDMCTFTTIANMTAASVRRNGAKQYRNTRPGSRRIGNNKSSAYQFIIEEMTLTPSIERVNPDRQNDCPSRMKRF